MHSFFVPTNKAFCRVVSSPHSLVLMISFCPSSDFLTGSKHLLSASKPVPLVSFPAVVLCWVTSLCSPSLMAVLNPAIFFVHLYCRGGVRDWPPSTFLLSRVTSQGSRIQQRKIFSSFSGEKKTYPNCCPKYMFLSFYLYSLTLGS